MRVGMISNRDERDIKFASEAQIPWAEFIPWCPMSEFLGLRKDLEGWLSKHKVGVSAMGFFNRDIINADAAKRESDLKDVREMIALCKDWKVPVFMIGAGKLEKDQDERAALKQSIEQLKRIVDDAGKHNITVAVYNCHCWNYCTTPRHWEALLATIPQIRFKYDCSHSYYDGRDYLSELRDFGKYLAHFHVKGCIKAEGRQVYDPPAGLDQIAWRSVIGLLYRAEYQGVLSLEPHSKLWTDPEKLRYPGLRHAAKYIKSLLVEE